LVILGSIANVIDNIFVFHNNLVLTLVTKT
jgi:hypothetical protein